ncbi:MAG: protoporphyrinogen oxidase [Planctomycetes bacterium]|nr:protoporphyrinogen oxidase [Planctomycetota bacterium]
MKHVAIIGGGISGLAAAYRLHKAGARVTLLEATDHLGGVIGTVRHGDCLLETGPDCWASNKPAAMELANELGLGDEIIGTRAGVRRSFILHHGSLKRLPEGFFLISPMSIKALIKTPILSWPGKIRMALELFKGVRRDDADESLASFVRRRFGKEALARIAQPMIAGIYTADPEKLSLKATFPAFIEMERKQGSVIKALRKRAKGEAGKAKTGGEVSKAAGPRYGLFVTFKGGMSTLPDALADALPEGSIRKNTRVAGLKREGESWQLVTDAETINADAIVLALPAHASAGLLRDTDAELTDALGEIEYAGAAVVNFIFDRSQIVHSMDGIGAVIPAVEGRRIIAFSYSSVKFEGRAPEGTAVVRVFMGGALNPEVAQASPDEQTQIALEELRGLIGVKGEPKFALAGSHKGAMAQYHVGHLERVAKIRELARQHTTLAIIGNGFDGVGIPDCIRNANEATATLLDQLGA